MKNIITRKIKASSKFKQNKNYAGFWMNDSNYYNNVNQFAGLNSGGSATSDMVKVVKLASYRKAVANFVKIVTKKDIPVIFSGTDSYTDFDKVVLTTDIKDDNFDVTVGLALHEASHISYTDRNYLESLSVNFGNMLPVSISVLGANDVTWFVRWKSILNWIEDRRIDNIVFKSSPGYKAYYHKLYDYYWNSPIVDKALKAPNAYRNPSLFTSYEFQIINSLNKNSNPNALPGLREILQTINVANISRLTSVQDAGQVAGKVIDIIIKNMNEAKQKQQQQDEDDNQQQQQPKNGKKVETDGEGNGEQQPSDGDGEQDGKDLTSSEIQQANQQLDRQEQFLNGKLKKKAGTKSMNNRLDSLKRIDVEVQQVGSGDVGKYNALIYNLTSSNTVLDIHALCSQRELINAQLETAKGDEYRALRDIRSDLNKKIDTLFEILPPTFTSWKDIHEIDVAVGKDGATVRRSAIDVGLELGALLGRKLQTRNEVRELVHNRTRTGSIDKKRLADAGYGVESIFKQIHVDKFKKGLLHISLDASGSMSGDKWRNTVLMTVAICKAISMTQNMNVTVDLRCTERGGRAESPTVVYLYDSRVNKLNHLVTAFKHVHCSSMTPEGLCTEAMIKRGYYKKSDATLDTFYLNICDGEPGGIGNMTGDAAILYTAKQVNTLRNEFNMQVLGYFISQYTNKTMEAKDYTEAFNINSSYGKFFRMYGRGSKVAPVQDMHAIAKHMNNLFLSKGCMV